MGEHKADERPRWAVIYEAMVGASAPGSHHEEIPGVQEQSLKAGHEPDAFDAKGIVMVPILVCVVTGMTYVFITLGFSLFKPGAPAVAADASSKALVRGAMSYNERLGRINSSNVNAEVVQPRLEFMRKYELERKGSGTTDPEWLRSFRPQASKENSPELTPQDLYPNRYVDLLSGRKVLIESEWLNKEKGIARIPVQDAMQSVLAKLPVKKDARPSTSTTDTPKGSNGGQATTASVPATVIAPKEAPKAEKADDHKPSPKK